MGVIIYTELLKIKRVDAEGGCNYCGVILRAFRHTGFCQRQYG